MTKIKSAKNLVDIFLKTAQRRRIVPQWQSGQEEEQSIEYQAPQRMPRVQDFSIPEFSDFDLDEPKAQEFTAPEASFFEPSADQEIGQQQVVRRERPQPATQPMSAEEIAAMKQQRAEEYKLKQQEDRKKGDRFSRFMEDADKELKEKQEREAKEKEQAKSQEEQDKVKAMVEKAKEDMAEIKNIEEILKMMVKAKRKSRPSDEDKIQEQKRKGLIWSRVDVPKMAYSEPVSFWILTGKENASAAGGLIKMYYKYKDSLKSKKEFLGV